MQKMNIKVKYECKSSKEDMKRNIEMQARGSSIQPWKRESM